MKPRKTLEAELEVALSPVLLVKRSNKRHYPIATPQLQKHTRTSYDP